MPAGWLLRLRTMLLLRALLDRVGAVQGDLEHNIAIVGSMFPGSPPPSLPSSNSALASSFRSSSSPAARTASLVARQLAVHQRLWAMSEGYSTSDARTVRSVDVGQLDELYDIVNEACSTNLFGLRPTQQHASNDDDDDDADVEQQHRSGDKGCGQQDEDGATRSTDRDEKQTRASGEEEKEVEADADNNATTAAMPNPRLLLLNAVAKQCTVAELRYLFSELPAHLQRQWVAVPRQLC